MVELIILCSSEREIPKLKLKLAVLATREQLNCKGVERLFLYAHEWKMQ